MDIYRNIQLVCKERGIKVAELERELGLTKQIMCKWSKHEPGAVTLKRVADALGVTVDSLIR